ncbi:hypothetical protein [Moraxella lacunata]|uniref:hypothetical protein n=1 Tax=Moraxella lacunata TaxID=477 RepID=UPI003EE0E63D
MIKINCREYGANNIQMKIIQIFCNNKIKNRTINSCQYSRYATKYRAKNNAK